MQEFRVNEYLSLRLEKEGTSYLVDEQEGGTVLYVGGDRFLQCKYLLLTIKVDEMQSLEEIESIDEASERLDTSQEYPDLKKAEIPPETEFWGHCSNLQVWYENDYDTRLLHSNLAFPLLKRLTEVGDPRAQKVFKEEIAKRFTSCFPSVMVFLLGQKYLDFLDDEEIALLLRSVKDKDPQIYRYLLPILMKHKYMYQNLPDNETDKILIEFYEDPDRGFFDGMELDDYFWRLREKTILQLKLENKKEKNKIRYNRSYQG